MSAVTDSWRRQYDVQTRWTGVTIVATVPGYASLKPAIRSEMSRDEVIVAGGKGERGGFTAQMLESDFSSEPPELTPVICPASAAPITAATLSTNLSGTHNDLTFTAAQTGDGGNDLSVEYLDPAANNASLSIATHGNEITVYLATGAGGAITSTGATVLAAINADADASALLTAALKTGNDGTGIVTAMADTNLSGGVGVTLRILSLQINNGIYHITAGDPATL